jgi:hypothetical protein
MSSGKYGSKNERGETVLQKIEKKTDKELHLLKLLTLVSGKI